MLTLNLQIQWVQKNATGCSNSRSGRRFGGPTPENYKSDDDSAKLKTPGATLKQVRDIVNKGAKPVEAMPNGRWMKEEEESEVSDEQEVVSEEEVTEEEELRTEVENEISESEEDSEEEVAEEEVVEIDIDADIQALIQGEDLSEEFQEKAKVIFETAINAKLCNHQRGN